MAVPVQHIEPSQLIPSVQPGDSDQLAVLLETAQVLLDNGDAQEALRWIRRAATLAAQEGNDDRALTLARAAADFATEIGGSPATIPPRKSAPPPPSLSNHTYAAPTTPSPGAPPPPSVAPTTPSVVHSMPVATSATAVPSPPSRIRHVPRSSAPPPLTILPPAKTPETTTAKLPAVSEADLIEKLIAEGRAVRVSVKRSARDNELYVVRRQKDGKPPLGTRQAVLLLNDLDPEFFEE